MESKNLLHWDQAVLRLKYYLDSSKRLQELILSTVSGSKPGFLCSSLQTSFITSADTSLISLCLNASKPPFWQESESYRQYLMWSISTTAGRFDSTQLYLIRITSQTCFFCFIYICVFYWKWYEPVIWSRVFDWFTLSSSDLLSFLFLFDLIILSLFASLTLWFRQHFCCLELFFQLFGLIRFLSSLPRLISFF